MYKQQQAAAEAENRRIEEEKQAQLTLQRNLAATKIQALQRGRQARRQETDRRAAEALLIRKQLKCLLEGWKKKKVQLSKFKRCKEEE